MVTVTFQIKPYLAAYMYMRYKNHLDVPPLPHFPRTIFSTPSPSTTLSTSYPFPTLPTPHGTKPEILPSPSPIPETVKIQMYIII